MLYREAWCYVQYVGEQGQNREAMWFDHREKRSREYDLQDALEQSRESQEANPLENAIHRLLRCEGHYGNLDGGTIKDWENLVREIAELTRDYITTCPVCGDSETQIARYPDGYLLYCPNCLEHVRCLECGAPDPKLSADHTTISCPECDTEWIVMVHKNYTKERY